MRSRHLLCTLLLLAPLPGAAATLQPGSNRIDAVTIFLDRAEVERKIAVNLISGSHTLRIDGLPAQLIEASLKLSGKGPQGLRIGAVELQRHYGEKAALAEERQLREQLAQLQQQKAQLEARSKALDTRAKFIERLASLPDETDDNGNRIIAPEKWATAWQAIGKGMEETGLARVALQREMSDTNDAIRKVESELRQIQTGRRDTLSATIALEVANPGKGSFTLGYQVPGASWAPLYDARLDTTSGKLELAHAANVRQASGEAWENITLTVSTARPSAGAQMPELPPWWIDFQQPRLRESRLRLEKGMAADEMLAGIAPAPQAAPAEEAEVITASAAASEFSLHYRIPGRVSVPADSSRHRFALQQASYPVTLSARATPKRDPRAFLYATLDYSGEAPLLPGPWQLQRDGVFVGSVHQEALRPGEKVDLAFGPDDAIKVDYQLLKDEAEQQGLINREKETLRNYRITIESGHKKPLPFTLFDQLPVARNKAIEVELAKGSTPPSRRNVDNRPGVLAWDLALQPQKRVVVDFGYRVSHPQDKVVPGF